MNSEDSIGVGGIPNMFGGGFGDPKDETAEDDNDSLASGGSEDDYDYGEDNELSENIDAVIGSLATTLTNTSISSAPSSASMSALEWDSIPAYPAIYLNTVFEYISPPKSDIENKAKKAAGKAGGGDMWDLERYERPEEVDEVFQKFALRVAEEGTQCIRQVEIKLHLYNN
jgi:pre-rRNA-processing protein TSR4